MLITLEKDEKIRNEVTGNLFTLLERQSLFKASEYLALNILDKSSVYALDENLARQLETYRAMKIGNTVPDITFGSQTYFNGKKQTQLSHLSSIKTPYTLVVFGASWCPKCVKELPKLQDNYPNWKALGVEIVYVSLDTDQAAFEQGVKSYPFIAYCDFKQWDSPVVKDYYIFGTPTFYLLNAKQEIVLRPISVAQINAWLDLALVKGKE